MADVERAQAGVRGCHFDNGCSLRFFDAIRNSAFGYEGLGRGVWLPLASREVECRVPKSCRRRTHTLLLQPIVNKPNFKPQNPKTPHPQTSNPKAADPKQQTPNSKAANSKLCGTHPLILQPRRREAQQCNRRVINVAESMTQRISYRSRALVPHSVVR